jgi:hypothetical protein
VRGTRCLAYSPQTQIANPRLKVTVQAHRILAQTILDEPVLRSRIIRKEFEYLFECYTLANVFSRTVHLTYPFVDITCAKPTGNSENQQQS